MSKNRENVTWQSPNGTWNLGFFKVLSNSFDEDSYDSEWNVDYDYDVFEWVSIGHSSARAADDSWNGPNPGTGRIVTDSEAVAEFDVMAKCYLNPAFAKKLQEEKTSAALAKHFTALQEKCEQASWFAGATVHISVGSDEEAVATGFGMFTSHTGRLVEKGNWLMVDDVKVWDKANSKFNLSIYDIRQQVVARSRYSW